MLSRWGLVVLGACAKPPLIDGETGEEPTYPEEEPLVELKVMIPAAEGGELRLGDGAALSIPPGALSADAEVRFSQDTCEMAWSSASFGSCRYSVDAGDTAWVGRFSVSIPTRTEGPAWAVRSAPDGLRPLVDSAEVPGAVEATGSKDGAFTSRMAARSPPDDRCTDVPFEPCGGDLGGQWMLTDACGSMSQVVGFSSEGTDPYEACKPLDAVIDYPFAVSGSVTFASSGTFEASSHATVSKHETATLACLETIGESCHPDCTDDGLTCDCTWGWAEGDSGLELTWVLVADGVEIEGTLYRYCVDGDTLALEYPHTDGPYLMYYARSP